MRRCRFCCNVHFFGHLASASASLLAVVHLVFDSSFAVWKGSGESVSV